PGNHDRYTGADAVIKGVRDAGQTFVKNGVHVIEHRGAAIALVGIDDPRNWRADDPQDDDLAEALRVTPPASQAFRILLAHRPGAFRSEERRVGEGGSVRWREEESGKEQERRWM